MVDQSIIGWAGLPENCFQERANYRGLPDQCPPQRDAAAGRATKLIDFSRVLPPFWTAGSLAAGWSQAAAIAPLGGSIQELPGHSDARTTEISTYVAKVMRWEIGSPLDDL
jgi:hypothetical protein